MIRSITEISLSNEVSDFLDESLMLYALFNYLKSRDLFKLKSQNVIINKTNENIHNPSGREYMNQSGNEKPKKSFLNSFILINLLIIKPSLNAKYIINPKTKDEITIKYVIVLFLIIMPNGLRI